MKNSPNEMNRATQTIIIAPMTSKSHNYPTLTTIKFKKKDGWVVLDQIRTVDRKRLIKKLGKIKSGEIRRIKSILQGMSVD